MRKTLPNKLHQTNIAFNILLSILLFTILFSSVSFSAEIITDAEIEFSQRIESGIEYLYNLDRNKAKEQFRRAIELKPLRPEGYFYTSMIYWNKIYFESDMDALSDFEEWIDKTIEKAEESTSKSTDNREKASALLYLGGAYGYKGAISIIKRKWFSGFVNAYKGRKYLNNAYNLNPDEKDIYLGLGMYDYFLDKLPKTIKILTYLISFSGDRKGGLEKLKECAEKGRYAKTEALIALANIYIYLEKDYKSALPVISKLKMKYPNNPQFHYLYAIVNARLEKWSEAVKTADFMFNEGKKNNKHFKGIWETKTKFLRGEICWIKKDFSKALEFYNSILASERAKNIWVFPMAEMRIGMINDFLNHREEAKKRYLAVLSYKEYSKDYAYLYDYAKKYLKKPCRIDDPERMD
ncbi:MAG: hypothetical protein D6734_10105 [Candidatus Schekmanbacteria bacterium]|nr:MAG: hypothetical protein D6734_10105 [Candidatus Schekmanbacteria bacterium]